MSSFPNKSNDFEKYLVSEYFRYGSINKVYSAHHFDLPISFASYHRVLTKFGVVKSAGPNSQLSESLDILAKISTYKIPLEKTYHKYAPQSVQVSVNTLHRILHYTRLGLTRRQGTALIITLPDNPNLFLVGNDQTLSNPSLGHKGDISLPMGHSKTGERPSDSIARVLQQEVFTDLVIEKSFPWEAIPPHPRPIMYINIADIRVAVYHLEVDSQIPLSSFKLKNLRYTDFFALEKQNLRPGIADILQNFYHHQTSLAIPEYNSTLNNLLYSLAKVPEK